MDFFQSQDSARRRTGLLVFCYIIAVIFIILAVYAVFTFFFTGTPGPQRETVPFWDIGRMLTVAAGVLLVVGGGTLFKTSQLKEGGRKVARLLGGREVSRGTKNRLQRRLINVVEEMSIASGVQVPRIFILDREEGINAFAAGFSQDDAAIAVTAGCLETLSRQELQGVIAHEFSHILNGDMRLNIKLMGVLFGITVITFLGYMIFRSFIFTPRRRSSSRGGGGGKLAVMLFALALMIIGYIGVFFSKLIKSAVSRQREYLADAAAVQFTRNPSGIAGALKKISDYTAGTAVENPHAREASHLFFAGALQGTFAFLFSTHPPIEERINRIDPSVKVGSPGTETFSQERNRGGATSGFGGTTAAGEPAGEAEKLIRSVGTTDSRHLAYASRVMEKIRPSLKEAARREDGAEALMYALLFSSEREAEKIQSGHLRKNAPEEVLGELKKIAGPARKMPVEYRIPLMDIAISSLKNISPSRYRNFKNNIQRMVEADGKISIFEYTVQRMILRHLEPAFTSAGGGEVRYRSFRKLKKECRVLLSALARSGIDRSSIQKAAFREGAQKLQIKDTLEFLPENLCTLEDLDRALDRLNLLAGQQKKKLLRACISCVAADGVITTAQAELIRITADALGCPVPPILPSGNREA